MGKTFDTALLAKIVSDIAGQEVEMIWCYSRDLPDGLIGAANCRVIMLDEALARRCDPILPEVVFHEMAHVLLHKRYRDHTFTISDEDMETEAMLFANEMLLRTGEAFIWDALTGDLDWAREMKLRAELGNVAKLRIFKRNRIVEAYQRVSQSDVEVVYTHGRKTAYAEQHSTLHRTPSTRQGNQSVQALEAQARHEHSLANRVADPRLRDMIRNSAQGKVERAQELKTGRPTDPKASKYELRIERSTLQR